MDDMDAATAVNGSAGTPMTPKEMLQRRLEESYRASKYHSFLNSLKGVTEEAARWLPPHYKGFPHMNGSILNLAYHTAGDKFVLMSNSFGDGSWSWPKVEAHFTELGGDLTAAKQLAEEGHALVLATLEAWDEDRLEEARPYYGGKTHTALEVFSIVAEHDVYHAGQINFVRCICG
jgi:hypothetical protein